MLATGWAAVAGSALASPQAGRSQAPRPDNTNGTRTLVCIYLLGGSDGNSLVAPLDPVQYEAWEKARGELGIRADALLPIRSRSTGTAYGLDYRLGELQRCFNDGAAAVMANVGATVRPGKSKGRYDSLAFLGDGYPTLNWAARKSGAGPNTDVAFTFAAGVSMLPIGKTTFEGERRQNPMLMRQIASASFRTSFPDSTVGRQVRTVAGLIRAGNATGATAQVVFCPFGGFGTSTAQAIAKAPLYRQLSLAMAALYEATVEMGVADRVTIFTDSEFGRTLRPNNRHGADPGWGNHHFVLGGAVKGGDVYGKYPDMISGPFDADSALIPTTSNEQYQAALAGWTGIESAELLSLLPGLRGDAPGFLRA